MVKPNFNKPTPKVETIDANDIELVKDENAGEIEIKAVKMPTIEIVPGKKVKIEGKGDVVFSISQKLNNGKVSVLGPEGLILYVKPEDIRDVK